MNEISPEFDHFDFEPILAWAEASVSYCDEFVDGEGTIHHHPELGCWGMGWKNGAISFLHLIKETEDEQKARMTAALFIYLWTRGIEASIADNCASSYVMLVEKKKL